MPKEKRYEEDIISSCKNETVFSVDSNVLTKERLFECYPSNFNGLGCFPGEYTIQTDENVSPIAHPPRKVPIALKTKLK